MNPRPPRLARWIVSRATPVRDRRFLLADLEEEFAELASVRGRRAAVRWYWRQVVRSVWPGLGRGLPIRVILRPRKRDLLGPLWQDLQFGFRTLRRRPTFAAGAVLTLGLGIGATTTIFGIAEATLEPLPYSDAERVVGIWSTRPEWRGNGTLDQWWDRVYLAYSEYESLRDGTDVFASVALFRNAANNAMVADGGPATRMTVGDATSGLQQALGVPMILGRWFLPGEEGADAALVIVLSERIWRDRFDADPEIIGRSVLWERGSRQETINLTIVGVVPDRFRIRGTLNWGAPRGFSLWRARTSDSNDLWMPIGVLRQDDSTEYEGVARLEDGVTLEQALAQVTAVLRGDLAPHQKGARLARRRTMEGAGLQSQIWLLAAPSLLLLLIACGNIATLLLGEAAGRQREIATRLAVGASRSRVYRQLLTESMLLGVLGSGLGVLIATVGLPSLVALAPEQAPLDSASVNALVLGFASAAGIASGLLFGIAPVLAMGRSRFSLARVGGSISRTTVSRRFQSVVISGQVAFTVALLVIGGLLAKTLTNLRAIDPGFDATNVTFFEFTVPPTSGRYDSRATVFQELLAAIGDLPGVETVSGTQSLPFGGGGANHVRIQVAGHDQELSPQIRLVFPDYHETMGMELLAGRLLTEADRAGSDPAAVISRKMATTYWPNRVAIGEWFEYRDESIAVVGVVEDVSVWELDEIAAPTFYVPASFERSYMRIVIKSRKSLEALRRAVQRVGSVADPGAEVGTLESLSSRIAATIRDEQFHALMVVPLGVAAVALALIGIAGVTARAIRQRYRELGIRAALGARHQALVWLICRETLTPSVAGIALGLMVAGSLSRALSSFLYSVHFWDSSTFVGIAALLLLLSVGAGYVPTWRLRGLNPAQILGDQ